MPQYRYRYRVVENKPYGTRKSWRIEELWPEGVIRTPFHSRQEAIQTEEEIAEFLQFDKILDRIE